MERFLNLENRILGITSFWFSEIGLELVSDSLKVPLTQLFLVLESHLA